MMATLPNTIYGAMMMKTQIQIRNRNNNNSNNRLMIKRETDRHPLQVIRRPVVLVDHVRSPDQSHFRVLVPNQILSINQVRWVATAIRNRPAMVVVDGQVLGQGIADRIVPDHGRVADHRNGVVDIMMDVVVNSFHWHFVIEFNFSFCD